MDEWNDQRRDENEYARSSLGGVSLMDTIRYREDSDAWARGGRDGMDVKGIRGRPEKLTV